MTNVKRLDGQEQHDGEQKNEFSSTDKRDARRKKLLEEIEQKQALLQKMLATDKAQKKKRDDKLKIMSGACVLEMVKMDPDLKKRFRYSLKEFLKRSHEKVVLEYFDEEMEPAPASVDKKKEAVA